MQFKTALIFLISFLYINNISFSQQKVFTRDSSAYAIGDIIDGKKQGKWQFYTKEDNLLESGEFFNDNRQGEWKIYDANGNVSAIVYYEDNSAIYYKSMYANGITNSEGKLENGNKTGPWTTYYPTGAVKEIIQYENNEKNGLYRYFEADGMLSIEARYSGD
jgi:antitoxin component YwqK of YwqJK toxin-antitoxin module